MTVNLYQTGVSALLATQQQLATTSHNIANVNTEGYSRQRAEQEANVGIFSGGNYIGSGTYVSDITRLYNQFSYKEQLLNQTNKSSADASFASLNQLNEVLSTSGGSLGKSLNTLYQSLNTIADSPADLAYRDIALNRAGIITSDFNSLNASFDRLEKSTNGEIEQIVGQISKASLEIAKINEQILNNRGITNQGQPNDLLDERDRLLSELSKYTHVNTVADANGVVTVLIGSGTTLVAGITPLTLQVNAGNPDPLKTEIALLGAKNNSLPIKSSSLGGSLGAKLKFRDEDLTKARSEMNRVAMAISEALNSQQAEGIDLNQQQGANIFTDINRLDIKASRVLAYSGNTGSLQANVAITDISKVPSNEFDVRFDGTNYQMTNLLDGTVTNLGAPGAGTYNTAYGFDFVETSGTPTANDRFTIRPTENGAALMAVTMTDGASIAASSAVLVTPSSNNVSAGEVNVVAVSDPVNARLAMPMRIDILENPAGTFTYTVTDNTGTTSAPIAYTPPSQTIQLPATPATSLFSIEISGRPSGVAPNAPEQFTLGDAFGVGNATNVQAMALTQDQGLIEGNRETFSQSMTATTAKIGGETKSAELVANTAQALFTQAFNRNQEVSGVNLDEEAANLLKFQQAYQAASRVITTANTLFDTLLSAVR